MPPIIDPGIPLAEEQPVMSAPVTAPMFTRNYDLAAASGNPAAAESAWAALAASGERPATARVYPPTDPSRLQSVMWQGSQVDPTTVNEVAEMAQQYNIPMASAAAAIDAQMRFQAQRGYQRDLEAGMSATEAMAKWGPALFSSQLGRRSGVGMMPQRKFANVGGVGYFVDPVTGTATKATADKPVIPRPVRAPQGVLDLHRNLMNQDLMYARGLSEGKLDKAEATRNRVLIQNELRTLREQYPELMQTTTLGGTGGIPAPAASAVPRVIAPRTATTGAAGALPRVTTKAEFDKLDPGQKYIGKDGKPYQKPM